MPTCPQGHETRTTDFCEVCGIELVPPSSPPVVAGEPPEPPGGEACPTCGTPRGPGEFCEVCGYNFATGILPVEFSPPAPAPAPPTVAVQPAVPVPNGGAEKVRRWELHVSVDATAPEAPRGSPVRIFPLTNLEVAIGRRSLKRQITPDVSMDADDGISHRHASLRRQPDDTWAVLDLGSANGTLLNNADLPANVLTPLRPDDVLRLGRWTMLTLRCL